MTDNALVERPTHCPTCGVKLPDIPVSLCAYCASPVILGEKVHGGAESPNSGRIAKIKEHKTFPDVSAYVPPESPSYLMGKRKRWHGRNVELTGLALFALGAFVIPGALGTAAIWIGVLMGIVGTYFIFAGMKQSRAAIAEPLVTRPGMIVDRRSETAIRSWNGETVYFFTIEFEGGAVGEYRFDGRGASEDPYPSGMTGLAFLRGSQLMEFKQVRV